jgi:GDPmannose 4,6-dehydratase
MKSALITGITGQDGSYLAELLLKKGYLVHGLIRRNANYEMKNIEHIKSKLNLHWGDLETEHHLCSLINDIQPNEIYNLAAQSDVRISFDIPEYTGDVTALGSLRLFEAVKKFSPASKIYQACSSEMFGDSKPPQNEDTKFNPQNPYAVAKLYAYHIGKIYRKAYGLFLANGILFNHESPRRGLNFVTRKITNSVAKIYYGKESSLQLGNLNAKRDWGYAPEYVEAMWCMLQYDVPDDYVIATGETHSIREFVEASFKKITVNIEWSGKDTEEVGKDSKTGKTLVTISPQFFRPAEVDLLSGDYSKAKLKLKWSPKTTFKELVGIMENYDLALVEKETRVNISENNIS